MQCEKRERFSPRCGEVYKGRLGGEYLCVSASADDDGSAFFTSTSVGGLFLAHGCGRYPDGTIDWDYVSGDKFF